MNNFTKICTPISIGDRYKAMLDGHQLGFKAFLVVVYSCLT
ncbi:hypothetical protein [Nostoc sp. 2RC]|nr:hypothetical protein [Nostoc sp. 2RC]